MTVIKVEDIEVKKTNELCVKDLKQVLKFLKYSRKLDDNIRSRINEQGAKSCSNFVEGVVYPTWDNRISLIEFCRKATETAVPDDVNVANFKQLNEEERHEMLRIDPYGYKGLLRAQLDYEMQAKGMKWVYDRELEVDFVVRERSAAVLKDMCDLNVKDKYIRQEEEDVFIKK